MQQPDNQKPWYLEKQNFLESLNAAQLEQIRKISILRQVEKNKIICQLDDNCEYIGILKRGIAKVFLLTSEGEEVILAIRRAGDILGLTSIFGWPKRVSYVSALQDAELYNIKTTEMKKFILSKPEIAILIMEILGARLHHSRMMIEDLATRSVEHRLIRFILHMLSDIGVETPLGIEVPIALTHEQIAQLVASSRQTISTTIKDLERRRLIRKYRNRIVVLDRTALQTLLEGAI
jgi:CRP/FNR family transcriptional regulator, cyclic AMP receptor protein